MIRWLRRHKIRHLRAEMLKIEAYWRARWRMDIDATEPGYSTARDVDRDLVKRYAQIAGEIAYFESLLCSLPMATVALNRGHRRQLTGKENTE